MPTCPLQTWGPFFLKRMTRMLAGIRGCSAPFLRSCENFGMAQTRRAGLLLAAPDLAWSQSIRTVPVARLFWLAH